MKRPAHGGGIMQKEKKNGNGCEYNSYSKTATTAIVVRCISHHCLKRYIISIPQDLTEQIPKSPVGIGQDQGS